jgi:hypothetical protein
VLVSSEEKLVVKSRPGSDLGVYGQFGLAAQRERKWPPGGKERDTSCSVASAHRAQAPYLVALPRWRANLTRPPAAVLLGGGHGSRVRALCVAWERTMKGGAEAGCRGRLPCWSRHGRWELRGHVAGE